MTLATEPAGSSSTRRRWLAYDDARPVAAYDGLVAFAPMWAMAAFFNLAPRPYAFVEFEHLTPFVLVWASALSALGLLVRPRATWLLAVLSTAMIGQYAIRLPVASNNNTITTMMQASILLVLGVSWARSGFQKIDRNEVYLQLRVVARALLAIMYFYGIFHKINTDFLDPRVSCAVSLYQPIARPFGLADALWGKYAAIYATFIIEAIAIVGLYWRKFFAVGLIVALLFHFIIPISGFSWYMDFSSLVFALYMLSMPAPVAEEVYARVVAMLQPVRRWIGPLSLPALSIAVFVAAGLAVMLIAAVMPTREAFLVWHSVWILIWALVAGLLMVLVTQAAIQHLPYAGPNAPRQPIWLYVIPGVFFLTCLSPYVGLKTESSINMFSNLHTEGGYSNHLMMPRPPYLFDYQRETVRILDSSDPYLRKVARTGEHLVRHNLGELLRKRPNVWVTYEADGVIHHKVTKAQFTGHDPNLLERKLLIFKRVDYDRPKACTH